MYEKAEAYNLFCKEVRLCLLYGLLMIVLLVICVWLGIAVEETHLPRQFVENLALRLVCVRIVDVGCRVLVVAILGLRIGISLVRLWETQRLEFGNRINLQR